MAILGRIRTGRPAGSNGNKPPLLATISAEVAPGRHAELLVDQAGWQPSPGALEPVEVGAHDG